MSGNNGLNAERGRVAEAFRQTMNAYRTNAEAAKEAITEGRWKTSPGGVKYAWCGDLVTYVLMRAGFKRGLNRVALNGRWKPGENITMLQGLTGTHKDFNAAQPWDVLVLARPNGNHACFLGKKEPDGRYISADGNGPGAGVAYNNRAADDVPIAIIPLAAIIQGDQAPGASKTGAGVSTEAKTVSRTNTTTRRYTLVPLPGGERIPTSTGFITITRAGTPSAWMRTTQDGTQKEWR
jgi:hypothetical protein